MRSDRRVPTVPSMAHGHDHHHHDHVHIGEDDWRRLAEHTEREGEVFVGFVAEVAEWVAGVRGEGAPPVGRILDIGSGPGVGACEWAERFPAADVVAIDGSPAMLARAAARARSRGLEERVLTHHAELPGGLAAFAGTADVVWASMSLHHVGDEVAALRELATCLVPDGLLAIAEFGDPTRLLPADLGVGRPGLEARLRDAAGSWFAAMRQGLDGAVASADLEDMVRAAGLEVVGTRLSHIRLDAPLTAAARAVAAGALQRMRDQFASRLEPDDVAALDVLLDDGDSRSLARRPDAFVEASRRLVLAA